MVTGIAIVMVSMWLRLGCNNPNPNPNPDPSSVSCGYSTVIVTKMVAVMVGSMVIVEPLKDARLWRQPRDRDVGGRPMGCLTSGGGRDSRGARVVAHLVLQQESPRPRHEHA